MSSYYGDKGRDVPSWESFEAQDDDDIVDRSEYAYANKDHILFCIDASQSMQMPRPDRSNPEGVIKGRSALHQVLGFVAGFLKSKVITGPSDSVGVLLYNVDPSVKLPSGGSSNYKPGTYVHTPLRLLNAEEIKKTIKLVEAADDEYATLADDDETVEPEILRTTFPPCAKKEELNVADVLVTCNFLFRDAGTKLAGNKRVFLVTDNDDPPGSSTNRAPARTVYGDLLTYGITIDTFFIDRPDHHFNPTLYWNDILNREEGEGAPADDAEPDEDGLDQLAEIMDDLVIRNAPKRKQFTIPLRFGGKAGDIVIGVSGYSMISKQTKGQPKYVRMRGQTVEEVVTKTEYTSAETGATLRPEEISPAYQFGHTSTIPNTLEPNWWETGEHLAEQQMVSDEAVRLNTELCRQQDEGEDIDIKKLEKEFGTAIKDVKGFASSGGAKKKITAKTRIQFSPDEILQFKSMGLPTQIKILGFQSPQCLKFDENIKHSYFIYPDEDTYTGSTRTFAALLKSCLKLKRHALALCRFRANSTPEFAVLIPQEETFTKDGGQEDAPGFHVIILPFRDDMRQPPRGLTDNLLATEQQAKLMSNVVKRLRFAAGRYRSDAYPNPALAFHYAQLQSLAFEEDFDPAEAQTELDRTLPKHPGMHKAAGEFMQEWNRSIEEDERVVGDVGIGAGKKGTKRAAIAPAADLDASDLADLVGMYKAGTLDKAKVADLREFSRFHNISLGGAAKKADIIEALSPHLEEMANGPAKKTKKH